MLNHYSNETTTISLMSRKELIETTKCLMPCLFMEYKVSVYYIFLKTILFLMYVNCAAHWRSNRLSKSIWQFYSLFDTSIWSNDDSSQGTRVISHYFICSRHRRNPRIVYWIQLSYGLGPHEVVLQTSLQLLFPIV